jgi:hypothetical protein
VVSIRGRAKSPPSPREQAGPPIDEPPVVDAPPVEPAVPPPVKVPAVLEAPPLFEDNSGACWDVHASRTRRAKTDADAAPNFITGD